MQSGRSKRPAGTSSIQMLINNQEEIDQEREQAGARSDLLSFPIFLCLFPKMTIMLMYSFYVERNKSFYFEETVRV